MQKRLGLLLGIIALLLIPSLSFASVFNNVYLRLDSQKPNVLLSGTVCAQPSSPASATEAKVVVAFPADFTISQTASNWTTDTNNLPSGSTPWPGISSTASSVSNQGVTFNSNDLSSNVLYCFNFTGASSTTGSTGNDKIGTIATKTSSNVSVDLSTYAVSIVTNDNISVTASVDPHVSDLQATLTSLDTDTQFNQNTTLTYQFKYGSYLSSAFPIIFEANWSQGTIQGDSSPSVDILDYVTGSADDGINSVSPVIDTVHNKITWTYTNFPGNSTDNTLTFKLKTNQSYTGNLPVDFTVSAKATANSTVTPDSSVDQSYLYNSNLNPTSTPTPTSAPSTSNNTTTSTSTPTPTEIPTINNQFNSLEIRTISQTSASVYIETSLISKSTLFYGTNINNLNKSVALNFTKTGNLDLKDLTESTQYYFYIKSVDSNGKIITSDIFTFTTASAPAAQINQNSIVATSNNNIIYNSVTSRPNQARENYIVIPANTNFQFQFSFKTEQIIRKAKIVVRKKANSKSNRKVLGINNFTKNHDAASNNVTLTEIKPGVFTATIKSEIDPGTYDLLISFEDENGNLSEEKLTSIVVTNPLTIIDGSDKDEPIEGARVLLYVYNEKQRIFVPLSSSSINIPNPSFSNHNGYLELVLPKGKYKANISDIRYKERNVIFSIEDNDQTNYPLIKLYREKIGFFSILKYYYTSFNDVFLQTTFEYFSILNISLRFFDLIATVTLIAFVTITLFAFSTKHHIPLSSVMSYFFYLINHRERNKKYINGVVFSENEIVPMANVYLTDVESEQIIANTKTNNKGEFFFKKGLGKYSLMIMKKGYQSTPQLPYEEKNDVALKINLEKDNLETQFKDKTFNFISSTIGVSFETLLFLSLVFEILFIPNFGVKTLPFILVSGFNLFLWILHKHRKLIS